MMGENYPEKELLKNDLELTLRGCSAGRFVLLLTVCLLKEGQMGSASGNTGNPEPGGGEACAFSSYSGWQAFSRKQGTRGVFF